MVNLPISPFIFDPDRRFVLNEDAFMEEIEELPAFIAAPSPAYLAAQIEPLLKTLMQLNQ